MGNCFFGIDVIDHLEDLFNLLFEALKYILGHLINKYSLHAFPLLLISITPFVIFILFEIDFIPLTSQ